MNKYEQRASARVKFSRIDVSYVNLVRLSVRFLDVHRTVAYTVTIPCTWNESGFTFHPFLSRDVIQSADDVELRRIEGAKYYARLANGIDKVSRLLFPVSQEVLVCCFKSLLVTWFMAP